MTVFSCRTAARRRKQEYIDGRTESAVLHSVRPDNSACAASTRWAVFAYRRRPRHPCSNILCLILPYTCKYCTIFESLRVLIADTQHWGYPGCYHAGAEGARCAPGHAPVEHQTHLGGAPQVQVLPDDFFKEAVPPRWPVKQLGAGKFRLQDRQLVAKTCRPVSRPGGRR